MPKIVINTCYGGFNLSDEAVKYMIDHGLESEYYETNPAYRQDKPRSFINNEYYIDLDIPRNHPLLIEAVETLGEKANTSCSELVVKEFEGHKFRLYESDGREWLETPDSIQWYEID